MRKIHYKEDFPLIISMPNPCGVPTGVPDFNFTIRLISGMTEYMAGRRDGALYNCRQESDDRLCVFVDNHGLMPCAELGCEIIYDIPDQSMPDGIRQVVKNYSTGLSLTEASGVCRAEFEALLPYIKGEDGKPGDDGHDGKSAYEQAVESGYEGSESEFTSAISEVDQMARYASTESELEAIEPGIITDALRKSEQLLTEEEQKQVKVNIGIVERMAVRDQWLARLSLYSGLPTYEQDVANTLHDGTQFGLYGETFEYEDALAILDSSVAFTNSFVALYYQRNPRGSVLFPILTATDNLSNAFCQCQQRILGLYDRRLNTLSVSPSNMSGLFNSCAKLERIVATISMRNCTNVTTAFWNCHALREVRLHGLKMSISFQWSSKLSLESLTYMVGNSANTAAITITVHSAVYAKLTGSESADYGDDDPQDWHDVLDLALERNIAFAA